jgi:DNA-binding FadR family transcriptional regulator
VPLATIEHKRLYRQVADQLRALIEEGEFAPGSRLPAERDLAEKLGISRPTVREALIALEVEGRVRIRVGSGVYVADNSPLAQVHGVQAEGPFEVLRARQLIEAAIAQEAALRASPKDVLTLRSILAAMTRADHPSAEALRLDRDFHLTIAGIIGNELLVRMVGELFDQRVNPYFTQLASHFETQQSWAQALAEHHEVCDRIAAADAQGAHMAMRRHLQASQERFSQGFGEAARSSAIATRAQVVRRRNGRRRSPPQARSTSI